MSGLQLAYVFLSAIIIHQFSYASDTGKEVKSCELLLSPSSELTVTSSSSEAATAAAAAGVSFAVNTTVYLACRNSSLTLSGSEQLVCLQDGSWNNDLPTCQLVNVTRSKAKPFCPVESAPFANGVMTTDSNSVTISYRCNDGYRLIGARQLHCLSNNTWSAPTPRCIAEDLGDVQGVWTEAFKQNSKWQGLYDYDGQSVQFTLDIHWASEQVVKAMLQDRITQLELIGRHQNDHIVFNATHVIEHSNTMTMLTDWSVSGQLTKVGGHWVYSGVVSSSQPGFLKLMMSPATPAPSTIQKESSAPAEQLLSASLDYDYDDVPSSTALALGVTIAVVAIVVAGGLAAFCAHRGAALRLTSHSGHQTLTSFENPIYDAGHVVVK